MVAKAPQPIVEDAFAQFWSIYPRRVARKDALKAWAQLNPDAATVQAILDALAWQVKQEQWRRDDGAYVPYAATYLRGERWTDDPPKVLKAPAPHWRDECQQLHGGTCHNVAWHETQKNR
jgi:hypothetical protein